MASMVQRGSIPTQVHNNGGAQRWRSTTTRQRSGWAVGWTYFAAMMMVLVGVFHAIAGLVAIFDDEFFVATRNYVFQFDRHSGDGST